MTKKFIALSLVVVSALVATRLLASPSPKNSAALMSFTPINQGNWAHDNEMVVPGIEAGHFLYHGDEAVDLNIIRDDNDLGKDLATKGKDALMVDILDGQNKMNQMVGVGQTEVLDTHVEDHGDFKTLVISSQQDLPDGRVERLEKYFMAPGQTLHAELRWHLNAKADEIAQAKKEFADARFEMKEQ